MAADDVQPQDDLQPQDGQTPRTGTVYVRTMWGEQVALDFATAVDIGWRVQEVRDAMGGASRTLFKTGRNSWLTASAIGEVWAVVEDD